MFTFLFGGYARMQDLELRIRAIARSGLPVLIEGACGTGKETLAAMLDELNPTGHGLKRISCRQSGPVSDLGQLYRNTSGALFLKNVQVLGPAAQEQLLDALEQASNEGGGARILSSATGSLRQLVDRGVFSPALYYRLSVYRISLPPLCERSADIPEFFNQMLRHAANGSGAVPVANARLDEVLQTYDWPGNFRELENIARAYLVAGDAEEIIAELGSRSRAPETTGIAADSRPLKEQVKGAALKLESEIIMQTLRRNRWNRRRTAQTLQISYRSLLYKMKNCNLRLGAHAAPEGD